MAFEVIARKDRRRGRAKRALLFYYSLCLSCRPKGDIPAGSLVQVCDQPAQVYKPIPPYLVIPEEPTQAGLHRIAMKTAIITFMAGDGGVFGSPALELGLCRFLLNDR